MKTSVGRQLARSPSSPWPVTWWRASRAGAPRTVPSVRVLSFPHPPAGMSPSGRGSWRCRAPPAPGPAPRLGSTSTTTTTRTVEETDLYRLEGNRLYYLNGYRGLMVFDVTDVDQPALVGRSPIFGTPVDMIVRNGIAIVVVADWYGQMDDGGPFHGSIVRGLDATDPANIRVARRGEAGRLGPGQPRRGSVIYAVSEDYGWTYGWDDP